MKDLKKEISSILETSWFPMDSGKQSIDYEKAITRILALFEKRDRILVEKIRSKRRHTNYAGDKRSMGYNMALSEVIELINDK